MQFISNLSTYDWTETKAANARAAGARAAEAKAAETQTAEAKAVEAKIAEAKASEVEAVQAIEGGLGEQRKLGLIKTLGQAGLDERGDIQAPAAHGGAIRIGSKRGRR